MKKPEFKDLIQKVITSNSHESAKYARELRDVLIQASNVKRRNKMTTDEFREIVKEKYLFEPATYERMYEMINLTLYYLGLPTSTRIPDDKEF